MSDNRLIATRYVRALFDLAQEEKQQDNVKADMQMIQQILKTSPEFRKLLVNPVISRKDSESAVAKILGAIKACELSKKFFALLARNRRLNIVPAAVDDYLERLAKARGELTVQVTSAQHLSEEETNVIAGSIARATGKKVEIRTRENPALIGGVQIRIGSRMLDNSVAGKLSRLKQSLSTAA